METILIPLNIITFLLYGYDKFQAQNDGRRIPEKVLLALSLPGGIGGFLGMHLFRHKTRHLTFWLVCILGVVLNIYLLGKQSWLG